MNRIFPGDEEAFRRECRRRMAMPFAERLAEGFVNRSETYLPERINRSFSTMREYREWCHEHYPPHMGYRLVNGTIADKWKARSIKPKDGDDAGSQGSQRQ